MRGNGMPNINRSLCRLLCCCKSLPKKKHPGLNGFWQAKLRYENEISPTMVNWYGTSKVSSATQQMGTKSSQEVLTSSILTQLQHKKHIERVKFSCYDDAPPFVFASILRARNTLLPLQK
ncbi:uncharacterized protein LOC118503115 isoform X1 [Anopheles stephensi]|uniref:uncharacterized protein LOC118503115 isoform X1 n=1 Tax=Anopheles stephensi TaxID=30069 RepID=UPI001658A827|nr:uncharacterized protein LOC118503115 isoform X1 [Anopheles stephensi]